MAYQEKGLEEITEQKNALNAMNSHQLSVAMERSRSIFGLIASVIIAQTTINFVITFFTSGAPPATLLLAINGLFITIYIVVVISIGLELTQWFTDNNVAKSTDADSLHERTRAVEERQPPHTASQISPQTSAFCGHCGNTIQADLEFCPSCGKPNAP